MADVSIPILLVGFGVLIVVVASAVLVRHLLVVRHTGSVECSIHRRSLMGGESWQHGLMRFGTHRLRWFRAFSVRLGPDLVIRRSEIDDVERRRLPAVEPGVEDSYLLTFALHGGREVRAILDLSSGAAMTTWLEAAPTGLVSGDTD